GTQPPYCCMAVPVLRSCVGLRINGRRFHAQENLVPVLAGAGLAIWSSGHYSCRCDLRLRVDSTWHRHAFAYTQRGITATFSSPADPGGFQVAPSFFRDLTGNVLLDPGPRGPAFIPLLVTF